MSEPAVRQRQPLDLDEFERRLRGPDPAAYSHEDPLAELTRLVDGAQLHAKSLFAAHGHQASVEQDDMVSLHGEARLGEASADYAAPNRVEPQFGVDQHADHDDWSRGVHPGDEGPPVGASGREAAPSSGFAYDSDDLLQHMQSQSQRPVSQAEPRYDEWRDEAEHLSPPPSAAPTNSRGAINKAYVIAGAIGALVIGIGGTYALKGGSSDTKEIAVIKAAVGPTKIQPENISAASATQTASVLDKAGEKLGGSRVVGSVEQPVDINAQPRPQRPAGNSSSAGVFPDPIRVKTISVRPDGSIIPSDVPVASTQPVIPTLPPRPAVASAAATSSAATPAVKPAPPKATARVATRIETPAATDDDAPVAKPAAAKPALKPVAAKPVQKAALEPVASAGGGFSVQMGTGSSDAEARAKAGRIQAKFGGAFGGHKATVVKGDVNGKTVYRVRVVGLSQEGATTLCTKLKGEGGECFVAH